MEETRIDRIERYLAEFIQGMKEERIAIAELRESQKKNDEQIRSFHEKFMEEIRELKESQKKTDEQVAKTSRKVEETSKKLGELGITDGKVAEDLFYRNVRHVFRQKNIVFSDIQRNVRKKGIPGEYDIVAVNREQVLIVEVKKRMEQHMIEDFLNRKIPQFRQIFPEYRDFPLIGGVGALVMPDSISRYAEKKGLYVMTQNGEGGAMLVNRQNFTAKEF